MVGITAEQAQEHLQQYLDAEKAVLKGQTVEMDSGGIRRRLTLANLGEIQRGIELWQRRVDEATAQAVSRRRSVTMSPNW